MVVARSIKQNDSFQTKNFLLKDLQGCKAFASDWADEQEKKLGKVEEAKGDEVVYG